MQTTTEASKDFSWIWDKMVEVGTDGCWEWCGDYTLRIPVTTLTGDLPRYEHDVRRLVVFLTEGKRTLGGKVTTTCQNPKCVNPKHIQIAEIAHAQAN